MEKKKATTKKTTVMDYTLNGVKQLIVKKITSTYNVRYEIDLETKEEIEVVGRKPIKTEVDLKQFDLAEVTVRELHNYRKKGIPSFVFKIGEKFYFAVIPDNLSLVSSHLLGEHRCSAVGDECKRLSAACDELGGCAKVRDHAHCIERYPWITVGYETFNTRHDCFVVQECLHYEKCPPRKKFSINELKVARISLAQFLWPDVTSQKEVEKRVEANLERCETY